MPFKSVPYSEAFKCFERGGTIVVELNEWKRTYNGFSNHIIDSISWRSIFYGKWYIISE
jgi:hypothetical protein